MSSGKRVCSKHEIAFSISESCPYCVTDESVTEPKVSYDSTCNKDADGFYQTTRPPTPFPHLDYLVFPGIGSYTWIVTHKQLCDAATMGKFIGNHEDWIKAGWKEDLYIGCWYYPSSS